MEENSIEIWSIFHLTNASKERIILLTRLSGFKMTHTGFFKIKHWYLGTVKPCIYNVFQTVTVASSSPHFQKLLLLVHIQLLSLLTNKVFPFLCREVSGIIKIVNRFGCLSEPFDIQPCLTNGSL